MPFQFLAALPTILQSLGAMAGQRQPAKTPMTTAVSEANQNPSVGKVLAGGAAAPPPTPLETGGGGGFSNALDKLAMGAAVTGSLGGSGPVARHKTYGALGSIPDPVSSKFALSQRRGPTVGAMLRRRR